MEEGDTRHDSQLGLTVVLEVLIVAVSVYGMIVPGLLSFAAGFLGFSAVATHRALRRSSDRKNIAAQAPGIERALDLVETTKDWKGDLVEFGFIAFVCSVAIPTALQATTHGQTLLALLLVLGTVTSVVALTLLGRETVLRIWAQFSSRRVLKGFDEDDPQIADADEYPILGSSPVVREH